MDQHRIHGRLWLLAALSIVLTFWLACDDDSGPTEPELTEADWLIYHGYDADSFFNYVPVYSTKELGPVDTIYMGAAKSFNDMIFTSDGRYVAYSEGSMDGRLFWIQDYHTKDTMGVAPQEGSFSGLRISADDEYLLTVDNRWGLKVFSIPDMSLLWSDTTQIMDADFLNVPNHIVYCVGGRDTLYTVDFLNHPDSVGRTFIPIEWDSPPYRGVVPSSLTANAKTGRLYTIAADETGDPGLWIFDMTDFSLIDVKQLPDYSSYSRPYVSASGQQVFIEQHPGGPDLYRLLRYHPDSEAMVSFLDGRDIVWPEFVPWGLAVTPDDKTLCILVAPTGLESGRVMVVDLPTGDLRGVIDPDFGWGRPRFVRVYPVSR